jgi:cytidine deaminase
MDKQWDELAALADAAAEHAYAPYSQFPVGAAALVDDGRVLAACNVENASYGLGLCAECGLVSSLHATGGGRLERVVVIGPRGSLLTPCGRCRQLLYEHGGPDCLVLTDLGPTRVEDLLPSAFGPDDLGDVVR